MNWHEWFYYDETSPTCLRWRVNVWSGFHESNLHVAAGDVAGTRREKGFDVKLQCTSYRVHHIVFEMSNPPLEDGEMVDHFDGDSHNNQHHNLRRATSALNNRNAKQSKANTSGETGVCYYEVRGYGYWRATWTNLQGRRKSKDFSVIKFGDAAKSLAIVHRQAAIEELNQQGAGYTTRHGTTCSTPDSLQSPNL